MGRPAMPVGKQELIYELVRQGLPKTTIAARTGVSARTVGRIASILPGMPHPTTDTDYHTRYLSLSERTDIALLHRQGTSIRQIAHALGRAPSTISRELRRNHCHHTGTYLPTHAHDLARARQRRPKTSKIGSHHRLRWRVQAMLRARYSPEQAAGRLPIDFPDDKTMRISHESIYQSLYLYPRGELTRELKAHLRSGRTRRRPRGSRRALRATRITGLTPIHDRPAEAADRLIPGHHEGDLIKGSTASNSAVGTIVERHSGYTTLLHLPDGHTAPQVAAAVIDQMNALPDWFTKTLTWDRGTEMARHADITAATGITVYFADPYSPHQRPTNENTNGLLRQYLPKGEDLSTYTRQDLADIAHNLNNRPRKRLGFHTPQEILTRLIHQDLKHRGVATTP